MFKGQIPAKDIEPLYEKILDEIREVVRRFKNPEKSIAKFL